MLVREMEKNPVMWLSVVTVVVVAAGIWILPVGMPDHDWGWYPFIPVLFYVFGLFYIFMFRRSRRMPPSRSVVVCLVAKGVKMLVSVLVLFIYAFCIRREVLPFVVTYMVFYLVFLVMETYFFFRCKGRYKKN